jgi:isocitrate dehydrogenase (NAD+)
LICLPTSGPSRFRPKASTGPFFRENTEGAYAVGSLGFHLDDDIAVDFTITTTGGTERIARLAFDYAKKTGKPV